MKLTTSFLLPAVIGLASALSDASVYIFDTYEATSNIPTLTPEQARLVFAQRVGASKYHDLGAASEETLAYVNAFGAQRESLFQEVAGDKKPELLLIVEGVSSDTTMRLLDGWNSVKPAFTISTPPSMTANQRLAADLQLQAGQQIPKCALADAINPFNSKCWSGRSNVVYFDLGSGKGESKIEELMSVQKRLIKFAKKEDMKVVVALMPESSRLSISAAKPYGSYEQPSQFPLSKVRRQAEEPMTESPLPSSYININSKQFQASNSSGNSTMKPLPKLPALCHASKDACQASTNNCSGHGTCFQKFSSKNNKKGACFTCACSLTNETFSYADNKKHGFTLQSWGGAACQKRDVSSPFWLIAISTIFLVGIASWGIGLMYSIGEEKLPAVIGAGVSSKSR